MPERIAPPIPRAPVKKAPPSIVNKAAAPTAKAAPGGTSRRPATPSDNGIDRSGVVTKGFSGAKVISDATGDFAREFRPEKDKLYLIKFMEPENYAAYGQHWIERTGKKGFICIGRKTCPLCHIGDKANARYAFNILVFGEAEPELMSWTVGIRDFKSLETKANNPQQGPLPRHFWSVQKTGAKGSQVKVEISMVKDRDVDEDWVPAGIVVPGPDELRWVETKPAVGKNLAEGYLHAPEWAEALYKDDVITIPSRAQLQELAEELTAED